MSEFDPDARRNKPFKKPDFESLARAALQPHERLVWWGQPIAARFFGAGFAVYPFALLWTAFAIFWESKAIGIAQTVLSKSAAGPNVEWSVLIMPVFGIPFILVGLWLFAKPFLEKKKAERTLYILSDTRALVATDGENPRSFPYDTILRTMERDMLADGSGSLFFTSEVKRTSKGGRRVIKHGFAHIEKLDEVEDKLRRAVQAFEVEKATIQARPPLS